jgi:hypothetical protein
MSVQLKSTVLLAGMATGGLIAAASICFVVPKAAAGRGVRTSKSSSPAVRRSPKALGARVRRSSTR